MPKSIILVTGKNGQLGNELQLLSAHYPQFHFEFTDVAELDITNKHKVDTFFMENKPVACINAAAYTAVDKAESDRDLSMKINAEAVGILAKNCRTYDTRFIHISTDYVFDGTAREPYNENYSINPVNYYGLTKLKGEQAALRFQPGSIVIRTSWVYSFFGNNFVKTMLRLMKERNSLNVVNDQYGSPTYAADLADVIMKILVAANAPSGIYNYSNEGNISWFDFATAIRDIAGLQCHINPVDTAAYPTPAKRPAYSVLNKEKIVETFPLQIIPWQVSLEKCIKLLSA